MTTVPPVTTQPTPSQTATTTHNNGNTNTVVHTPAQLEYMSLFQQHNEILYNYASKQNIDPNIVSKLHQFISIFDTTPQSRHKIEVLAVLASNIQAFLPLFTQTLPQTSQSSCTYQLRANVYKHLVNPKTMYVPVKEDYATLSWTILRYIRHLTIDKDTAVRTQALRTIRYWCINDLIIEAFLSLGLDYLVARAIEREHRYLDERLQGLKLIRHIIQYNDMYITRPIIVTLLALSEQPKEEFRIVALDTLKDLLVTQPALILGTTNARQILIDAILDPALTEVSSPLTWAILYLYDTPSTRHLLSTSYDFGRIFACYTDLTNTIVNTIEQLPGAPPLQPNSPVVIKEKEAHRESAHRVLLTFMRSLAGLFALSSQPVLLQSFVSMLSLPSRLPSVSWAKESVFEFFYDTLRIVTSYDLVTHKRALLNYTKQRNFLAQKQQHQLSLLSQFVDGLQYTTNYHNELHNSSLSYSHGVAAAAAAANAAINNANNPNYDIDATNENAKDTKLPNSSSSSSIDVFSLGSPVPITNYFQLRAQLVQTQSDTTCIRHVSLLHTYMVLVLTVCIRAGLLEHLAMLTLCPHDELSRPALRLLTEVVRLSCGLFPAQVAAQLQTFPLLLQNAVVISSAQNQVSPDVHEIWQSSIAIPTDSSLPALSTNYHAPHTTPQYLSSLTASLKSITDNSNTSWALSHVEQSAQTSIRMQSLHILTSLFQENVKFLSIATTQDTFLSEHERLTAVSNRGGFSNNQGVGQIGDSTDGICKSNFIDHGIDLSRVVLDTDQTSSRHSFLSTLPPPVTMISAHFAAEEALYYEQANNNALAGLNTSDNKDSPFGPAVTGYTTTGNLVITNLHNYTSGNNQNLHGSGIVALNAAGLGGGNAIVPTANNNHTTTNNVTNQANLNNKPLGGANTTTSTQYTTGATATSNDPNGNNNSTTGPAAAVNNNLYQSQLANSIGLTTVSSCLPSSPNNNNNNNTTTIHTKLGPLTILKGTRRPHPKSRELHSLYLQSQIQHADSSMMLLLKQTNVLATKDQTQWDFNLVLQILETVVLSRAHFLAALKTKFFKRLLSFLRPDKHFFTEMYLTLPHATLHAKVAAQLIRIMVMYPEGREYQFFIELMDLIIDCLSEEAQRAESLVSSATLKLHPANQVMQTLVYQNNANNPHHHNHLLNPHGTDPTMISNNAINMSGISSPTIPGASEEDSFRSSAAQSLLLLQQQSVAARAQFDSTMLLELGLVDGEIGSPMYQLNQGFYNYSENTKDGLYIGPGGTIISASTDNGIETSQLSQTATSSIKSPKKGFSSFFANFKGDKKKDDSKNQPEDSVHQSRFTEKRSNYHANDTEPSLLRHSLLKSPFEDDSRFHSGDAPPAGGYSNPYNSTQNTGSTGQGVSSTGDEVTGPRFRPFSHHNVTHRLCREYVTIFGILSSTPYGLTILLRYGFFDLIAPFGACSEYDYLSRLFLFSLDFTNITTTTLHSTSLLEYWVLHGSTFLRRSIASLLRTISRQNVEKFRYIGIELCIALAHSPDPQVSLNALALLEETCHLDPLCLELVLKRAPDLTHFGQFVSTLYYSFLSKPEGVQSLLQNGWLIEQLKLWKERGYIEYVENSEYSLSLALSAHLEISAEDGGDSAANSDKSSKTNNKSNTTSNPPPTSAPATSSGNAQSNNVPATSINPQQSPYLGNIPSLIPHLSPKTSIWSQYSLYQPQLWSTRISIRQAHDDYLRQRLFQLPWNIEVVVETAQRRMVQLIVDTYVMEGFADSGTPVINDIMNANPYLAKHYGLSGLVSQESLSSYQEYQRDFKEKCTSAKTDSSNPQALSKQAMHQLGSLQNPPKQLLAPNDLEGAPSMWVCAVCLDSEGQPSPVEIDQYSILHSRVSPFILSTDVMPIGSSAVRHQQFDANNLFANLVNQETTRTITAQYIDVTTINNHNNTTAVSTTSTFAGLSTNPSSQNSPFHEIRKCYPFEREFNLLPSTYNIDNPTYIYNEQNTQINSTNSNTFTTFIETDKRFNSPGITQTLPPTLQTDKLMRHVHDLDSVTPYFTQPHGFNTIQNFSEDDFTFKPSAVLTVPSTPSCNNPSSIIPLDHITVGKRPHTDPLPIIPNLANPSHLQAFFEDTDGDTSEQDDEHAPPPPPDESHETQSVEYSTLSPRLPKYSNCSFYFLDGDVRWNFYRDPSRPAKLYLTSVWYKISPSHDILPSVSVVPHLYGELSKTALGCGLLYNTGIFGSLTSSLLNHDSIDTRGSSKHNTNQLIPFPASSQLTHQRSDTTISPALRLRAAMWGLAQVGTAEYGIRMLIRSGLVSYFTKLALQSPILSLRGTCFYLIGLLGLSRTGREHLNVLGWDCTEEDAQITSVGIAVPRNMLSFLHVESTPLSRGYPLQPLLSSSARLNGPAFGPFTNPATTVASKLNIVGDAIVSTDNTTGVKNIDIEDDIYSNYVYGLERVPVSNLDPNSERFRLLQRDNQTILSHCEYDLYGTPTVAAIELVLGHISNLCNHVSQRTSLTILRQWKQQYQLLFNSPILFAKVTQLLQMHTFGLPARRFIIFDLFGRVFAENSKVDVSPYMDVLLEGVKPTVIISSDVQQAQDHARTQLQIQ